MIESGFERDKPFIVAGTSQLAVLPPTSIHLETQHKALNKWGENGSFFLTLEHDNVSWIFSGKKQSKRGVFIEG